MDVRFVVLEQCQGVEEMRWVVTVYGCARLIDIRWFTDERAARSFYAEALAKYPNNQITIAKQ